jgi:thioester reductase-like protein
MILLTGATGFVGGELLVRLLEQTDREIIALIRADDDAGAQARLDETLALLLPPDAVPAGRVRAVASHLDRHGLGISEAARTAIVASVDTVVHCAASVSFTLPLEQARAINVVGTRAMLELVADAPRLQRFVHVSTAYVAGDRDGLCREDEHDVGQSHRNTYESTKLEAELAVLEAGLPGTVILRPSIVVGDSQTGWTPAFNVIYWPLQALARGLFPVIPGSAQARLDIVPIDTVADALLALTDGPMPEGSPVVHVVAGAEAITTGRIAEMAAAAFGTTPPVFVAPGTAPEAEERAGAFLPYFRVRGTFAQRETIRPPLLEDYFDTLLAYANAAQWGHEHRPRWAQATSVPSR